MHMIYMFYVYDLVIQTSKIKENTKETLFQSSPVQWIQERHQSLNAQPQVPSSGLALTKVADPQTCATYNPDPGSIGCAGPAPK